MYFMSFFLISDGGLAAAHHRKHILCCINADKASVCAMLETEQNLNDRQQNERKDFDPQQSEKSGIFYYGLEKTEKRLSVGG